MSIDIPADNGSVVVSDYNSTGWTFSTLSDPWNFDHPVSGNRIFGFIQNNDGSYNFFTRGVDRFTQRITGEFTANIVTGGQPFSGSDNLWESFQQGLKDYVNQHGGNASINPLDTLRLNWDEVKNVLMGNEPMATIDGHYKKNWQGNLMEGPHHRNSCMLLIFSSILGDSRTF